MTTGKKAVKLLADICVQAGITKVVLSPGSRSAPLVIAFSQMPGIECFVIPDERVAGYFALGIAQQLQQPVAVICTSGTAVLNHGPAIAEAYYQHVPLLFLAADRPKGASNNGENQAIEQALIFKQITNSSIDVDADVVQEEDLIALAVNVAAAINHTLLPVPGPVHINVRLSEPLYDLAESGNYNFETPKFNAKQPVSTPEALLNFKQQISSAAKKLLVVGMHLPDEDFKKQIAALAGRKDVVVLSETAGNLNGIENVISNYDIVLSALNEDNSTDFVPDIVITLGNQIISKRVRQFLKKHKAKLHWDIAPFNIERGHDIFDIGTQQGFISEHDALSAILATEERNAFDYNRLWQQQQLKANEMANLFLRQQVFSDLKVFETLSATYPTGANVQYGNSTPVRYANLFKHGADTSVNANRGTSGIDGCISTAAGAALVNKNLTISVVGDVSFFYDSNAFFHHHLSPGLRVIVINNSGGNIFRLIDGPAKIEQFETYFETSHNLKAENIALMFGLPYYFCDRLEDLQKTLDAFYKPGNKAAILEIKTDGRLSADIYRKYFETLRTNK